MSHSNALEACSNGDLSSLKVILSALEPLADDLISDLLDKAAFGAHLDIITYLLEEYNPGSLSEDVFRAAACSKSVQTFDLIHRRNPDCINEFYERRGTPLAIALLGASPKAFIEHLLTLGANPNIISGDAITPLAAAAFQYGDSIDMVELLLQSGAQVNGSGALAAAAYKGHTKVAKHLFERGANPNDEGNWAQASLALNIAVEKGDKDMVRLLLEASADPCLMNGDGKRAMDVAKEMHNVEIVRLLEGRC